jgi:hypothetical protein
MSETHDTAQIREMTGPELGTVSGGALIPPNNSTVPIWVGKPTPVLTVPFALLQSHE